MTDSRMHSPPLTGPTAGQSGFSLVEFLLASLVLLVISAAVFSMMAETQRTASYQTEVQAVQDNTRLAMDTVEHYIRQAANDPRSVGVVGVTITSANQVNLKSDITGSAGGDKGDPDGDCSDSGEDVTIRYNSSARSIEVVPSGGSAQTIANYISAFSMQYFDASGTATASGASVRRIRVTISGASTLPNPQTRQTYGITLVSDVQIANRAY